MKGLLFGIIFCCCSLFPRAQYAINMDSLKTVLQNAPTDSASIIKGLQQIETIYTTETEPLLLIGNWGLESAKRINNKYLEAYANMSLGFAWLYTSQSADEPAKHLTDALKISEAAGYYDITAQAYNGLATVYTRNGQKDKFREYTLRSIEASKKINLVIGIANGYNGLATSVYEENKKDPVNIKKALEYQRMGVAACESIDDSMSLIIHYQNFGHYFTALGITDSANYFLEKSKSLIDATGAENDNMSYYYFKGALYMKMKSYTAALQFFNRSIDYAEKYGAHTYTIRVWKAMMELYRETGDYKNAFTYYEKYKDYTDSVRDKQNFAKATDIQNKYEREKKDNEIYRLNEEQKLAKASRRQLVIYLVVALAVLTALGLLSFLLLKNIRERKAAYSRLEEKSIQIQEQAVQLSKQARLIAQFQSQMNPHFVFNALHNIQGLVISGEQQKATGQIQALAQLMRKTFANADKDDIPLKEEISYLQKYVEFEKTAIDKKLDFEVQINKDAEEAMIPPMMIQPFVENAIKHAQLTTVQNPYIRVLIEIENNLLSISVKDNGIGIRKEESGFDRLSHSMSVIKSRIELIFQEKNKPVNENLFSVKTVPEIDAGTLVKFYLPLNLPY